MELVIPADTYEMAIKANVRDAPWIVNIIPGWDRSQPFTANLLPLVAQMYLAAIGAPKRTLTREDVRRILDRKNSKPFPLALLPKMLRAHVETLAATTPIDESVWAVIVIKAYGAAIGVPLESVSD